MFRRILPRSFATRLSLWVIATAAVVMLGVAAMVQQYVRKSIIHEEQNRAWGMMRGTELRVDIVLEAVETAVRNNVAEIGDNLAWPDDMYRITRHIVEYNPMVSGSAVAFEPSFFPQKGRQYSPYTFRQGDSICSKQLGTATYEYHTMDWYCTPKRLGKGCWSEPYYDDGGGEQLMITYSYPLKDAQGNFYGVVTADLSIDWLAAMMDSVKNYDQSYTFIVSKQGTFITHPRKEMILQKNLHDVAIELSDSTIEQEGQKLLQGERGMSLFNDIQYGPAYIFYAPLRRTGWSMAIVCAESELFVAAQHVGWIVTGVILLGLVVLALVCYFGVRKMSRPLVRFTESANEIARGNMHAPLPNINTQDEMQQLREAFALMQTSLVQQMEELRQVNEQKGRIEGELHIASGIQRAMLPKTFPPFPDRDDVDLFGQLTPAKAVGGDLYDFHIRDEKLFFCIGDVSGKGVPASLVMAVTRSLFRTLSAHESSPERILTLMNVAMSDQNETNMFVTLFIGVLDLPTGRLRYSNAGHDAPLLVGSGIGPLPVMGNIPAGIMSDWKFNQQDTLIDPGTTIFLYTDGLTEAETTDHSLFGLKRVTDVAQQALSQQQHQPRALIERMTEAVHTFVGGAEQSDDLTMLAIQYTRHQLDVRLQRSITLSNNMDQVARLADFVEHVCNTIGFDVATTMQMNLAIEEAVVNIINYAYPEGTEGSINIEATASDLRLKFTITDSGTPFDPTAREEVDTTLSAELRPIGGLGIHLIRQLMDSINYERVMGKNVLTLRKKLQ